MQHVTTTPDPRNITGPQSGTIRVTGLRGTSFAQCSIGVVPEGDSARKVYQGPLVPGPWGYAVTHANVIDNSGLAAAERRQAQVVAVGEPFTVDGLPGVWMFRSPNARRFEGDGAKLTEYVA